MKEMSLSQEIENLEKKDFSIKEHKKNVVLEEVKKQVSSTTKKLEANILDKKTSEHKSSTHPATRDKASKMSFSGNNTSKNESSSNLPEIRKVALAKKRTHIVLLAALFISCFSLSVFIGFVGPFLLFK